MAKLQISVPSEKFSTTATFLTKEAPKTCKGVLKAFPLELPLIHGMMSGNESFVLMQGAKILKLQPENWVFNAIPGDVLFFYSMWGDAKYFKDNEPFSEIVFVYGRHIRLSDVSFRETAGNLFASMDGKLEEFASICKKARMEGPVKLRLEVI